MKIEKAKSAGFCFGVDNAVKMAIKAAETSGGKKVYTYGELIHNPTVVNELRQNGVEVVGSVSEADGGVLIIRSHGVGADLYRDAKEKNIELIDATCPYVKSIQNKVEKYHKKGYTIVIVGDKNHPEVIGINGWCDNQAFVIDDINQVGEIQTDKTICVVAQTTIIKSLFDEISTAILKRYPESIVFNTICSATSLRQQEAAQLAKQADAMIVIGGKQSSNTKKLAQICRENCSNVIHVETHTDIDKSQFSNCTYVGVTAGASTPAQIILEVIKKMENTLENFEKSIENFKQLKVGDIVKGEIVSVNENEVYLNIDYKSDGIIRKADFLRDLYSNLLDLVAVGDEVEAMIVDMNDGMGNVVLSKLKVDEIAAYDVAEEKYNAQETLNGKITKIVKGGMIVDLDFTSAFMPANQYDIKYIKDLNPLLGKEVTGRIIEFDKSKNRIIFSRKVILQEEYRAKKEEELKTKTEAIEPLELDAVVSGTVKNTTDFGVFIDLNGIDGFIHVSDLSWARVANPKNFCKEGDLLEAKVIELDKEKFRVKLSVKAMTQEPWQMFMDTNKVGDVVDVTIKNITKFGAFAEILPMVEGLIHISNLSHDKVGKVEDVVQTGQQLKAKIIDIDKDKRKIGLSIKDMTEAPKRKIEKNKIYYQEDDNATMADVFSKYLK